MLLIEFWDPGSKEKKRRYKNFLNFSFLIDTDDNIVLNYLKVLHKNECWWRHSSIMCKYLFMYDMDDFI